jgi:hypothetical protein
VVTCSWLCPGQCTHGVSSLHYREARNLAGGQVLVSRYRYVLLAHHIFISNFNTIREAYVKLLLFCSQVLTSPRPMDDHIGTAFELIISKKQSTHFFFPPLIASLLLSLLGHIHMLSTSVAQVRNYGSTDRTYYLGHATTHRTVFFWEAGQ